MEADDLAYDEFKKRVKVQDRIDTNNDASKDAKAEASKSARL